LAGTGHIKDVDFVLADKIGNQARRIAGRNFGRVDQQIRPLLFNAETHGLFGAADQIAEVKDSGSRGISHVLQRPLAESTVFQFPERITIWDSAELIEASSRTPAATIDSVLECNIEGGAIDASLSAGDYFHVPLGAF
jgi:hypothetical protein